MDFRSMASRQLDGYIEERFFSCKVVWHDEEPYRVDEDRDTGINLEYEVDHYSSNIDAAWNIIDFAREKCMTVQITLKPKEVEVVISSEDGTEKGRASAEFTPRALCEAAARSVAS